MWLDGAPYRPRNPLEARRAGVAMIYQELSLAPHLSVMENILLGVEPTRGPMIRWREVRSRAAAAMQQVGRPDIPLDARADGQLVRTKAIADQLVDAPRLLHDEVIGDQAPVAAPGNGLGAHHRGARPPRQAEQLPDAGAELRRTHVVCIIAEATVAPARSRRRVRALAAAARQLRNGDIPDSRASEGGAETSFAKLRHRPRSAQLPDVRDDADALLVKEREELVQRSVRMADGDDPRGPRQCPRSRFCIVRRTVSYPRSLKRSRARRLLPATSSAITSMPRSFASCSAFCMSSLP